MGRDHAAPEQGEWGKTQDLLLTFTRNIIALFRKCIFQKVHRSHGHCLIILAESVHSRKELFFGLEENLPPGDRLLHTTRARVHTWSLSSPPCPLAGSLPCKDCDGPQNSSLLLLSPLCSCHCDITAVGTFPQVNNSHQEKRKQQGFC